MSDINCAFGRINPHFSLSLQVSIPFILESAFYSLRLRFRVLIFAFLRLSYFFRDISEFSLFKLFNLIQDINVRERGLHIFLVDLGESSVIVDIEGRSLFADIVVRT